MLCRKPFIKQAAKFGCGQCMHCRYNRRRLWTHRMILEALVHPRASFVTLTYNKENLPPDMSLQPEHLTLFLKRLRKKLDPLKVRYFAVGEYGDQSWRPHYHAAIYGIDRTFQKVVEEAWGLGYVMVGDLTWDSAGYIAGYVTKKMTAKDDARLQGKHPEFARMSLRPGIGALSVVQVAQALQNRHGWDEISRTGDVPLSLRHGRKDMPLGRYLRVKLREAMEWEDTSSRDNPEETFRKSAELLVMYQNWLIDPKGPSPREVLESQTEQRRINRETMQRIWSKKGAL